MIYDKTLEEYVLKKNNIPREVYAKSIKIDNMYYSPYLEKIFKCIDIYDIYGVKYYQVEYDKKFHIFPFEDMDILYILYRSPSRNLDNILDGKYYFGYEILWWFVVNKIDISSDEYINFKPYIINNSGNNGSNSKIKSNEKYKIVYDKDGDRYYNIKFIKNKNKLGRV